MKNEGLIHHRPSKVQGDEEDMKGLAGIGFFVFFTTIAVWAGGAYASLWVLNRWDVVDLQPQWWELSLISAVINFVRLWDRAMFRANR